MKVAPMPTLDLAPGEAESTSPIPRGPLPPVGFKEPLEQGGRGESGGGGGKPRRSSGGSDIDKKHRMKSAMLSLMNSSSMGASTKGLKRRRRKVQPFTRNDAPEGYVWDYRTASKGVAQQAAASNTLLASSVSADAGPKHVRAWFYPIVEYGTFMDLVTSVGHISVDEIPTPGRDRPLWQTILATSTAMNKMEQSSSLTRGHLERGAGEEGSNIERTMSTMSALSSTSGLEEEGDGEDSSSMAMASFSFNQGDVLKRGDVGENVLHWSLLNSSHLDGDLQIVPDREGIPRAMAAWLIDKYGEKIINVPYQTRAKGPDVGPAHYGLYEGETPLHIALVKRDAEMTRLLLSRGASLRARAVGKFFSPAGPCYYGEYPLSFAVSIGDMDTVHLILLHIVDNAKRGRSSGGGRPSEPEGGTAADAAADEAAAVVWKEQRIAFAKNLALNSKLYVNELRDRGGNTCLHMAVLHGQADVYNELVEDWGADPSVVNAMGLTPLTLAARQSNLQMFMMIYSRQCHQLWEFGPAVGFTMPLKELDTAEAGDEGGGGAGRDGGKGSSVHSALRIITRVGDLSMVSDEMVVTLLSRKWELFAQTAFYSECVAYAVLMVVLFVLASYHRAAVVEEQAGAGAGEGLKGHRVAALETVSFLGSMVFAGLELYDYITLSATHGKERLITRRAKECCAEYRKPPKMWDFDTSARSPAQAADEAWLEHTAAQALRANISGGAGAWLGRKWEQLNEVLESQFEASASVLSEHPDNGFLVIIRWMFAALMLCHFSIWSSFAWGGAPVREEAQQITLALGIFFGWLYMLHYLQGFRRYGVLVIAIIRILLGPTLTFTLAYVIILIAFSLAFYTLGVDPHDNFHDIFYGLFTVFRMSLGEPGFFEATFAGTDNTATVYVLYIVFKILLILVATKVLIAMMQSTFNGVVDTADKEWRLHWARLILTIERRLPEYKRSGTYRLGVPDGKGEYHYVFEKILVPKGAKLID